MRYFCLSFYVLVLVVSSPAQQLVAPTTETVGSVRGQDFHGYNIINSFETGYRFLSTSGNLNTYKSNENFGNGIRLLSSYFTMDSKNGHGRFLDQIVLTTEGLGNDPNSSARLRVEKHHLYEYTMLWRQSKYFNPGLVTDGGQGLHLLDSHYTLQDHDLTLFPESHIRFLFGYTRDTQGGAGISSVQLFDQTSEFDATGNIFPVFSNVRIQQNEYRLGGEVHWRGMTLTLLRGWQDFKDDTADQFTGGGTGDGLNSRVALDLFNRPMPYHGTSPYWRASLAGGNRFLSLNARYTYASGARAFLTNEAALGTNQLGTAANQQIVSFGTASRPVATGNVSLSLFPTSRLTLTEHASLYDLKTDGDSTYLQFNNATQVANVLRYQYLAIHTFATETDALYNVNRWIDLHGGYTYTNRRITANQQGATAGTTAALPYSQTNELNSGVIGFRLRPLKPLTIWFDGELGHMNQPFAPRSEKDYSAISARIQYKLKNLQLLAQTHTDYNANSVTLSSYSSHSRTYSGSVSWTPKSWFTLDGTYTKLHLDTLGGIQFFVNSQLLTGQTSYYISNLHTGTLGMHFTPLSRLDVYLAYSHVQDTGDGRTASNATAIGPNLPAFQMAQTFPLRFETPIARLSIRISEKIRWNVGYQYFGYHSDFSPAEDYLAHTGYTSVLWSF